ncbi:Protein RADIALIS-like 6 [Ananas comosus]|uniref:Protein RADIALIS-like 6 n=1 Tax=Ananas comosus TaxID=4615 RepID=A0A199UK09_ANACO|nr:Protein RADIALIS-like 6 [Ananas comosus]
MNNDEWSWEQENAFEVALIGNQEDHADRWERIAAGLAGKTAEQVRGRYDLLYEEISRIESALIPLSDYVDEEESSHDSGGGKRERQKNPDRKKNENWTPEQHT